MPLIVLHLSFEFGTPCLWAEQGGKLGVDDDPTHFPYQPELKLLRAALKKIAPEMRMLKSDTCQKVVWLPSRGNLPIPSSPILGDEPDRRKKIALKPYAVTARPLSPENLLLLCRLAESGHQADGELLFGASWLWCARMLPMAMNMVSQEHYMPGMVAIADDYEARWLPMPDEQDDAQLEALALAMPAVCRCLTADTGEAPQYPPLSMVNLLLARLLDGLLRNGNVGERGSRSAAGSLHDAWLDALTRDDATVQWSKQAEVQAFSRELTQWQRPIDLVVRSPFKLCFRLSEPEDENSEWRVDYLLQLKRDPSTMVSLAAMWDKHHEAADQLATFGSGLQEFVLTALGQASGLCAEVAASLKRRHCDGFVLDVMGVCDFLHQQAEALRSAGFAVILPAWWVGRGPKSVKRLSLSAKARSPTMQGAGGNLDSLITFDLAASLGGETLSWQELQQLAKLKAPLVRLRGQWTMINQDEIQQALTFLQKQQQQSTTVRDLIAMALGSEKMLGGLPVDAVTTDDWLEQLLAVLTGDEEIDMLPSPLQFYGALRPYQQRGFSWLAFLSRWQLGACLADDMGLGKTVQTLALIQQAREAGETRPVLLICPTSVINNWRKEAERFTPDLSVLVHHGPDRRRKNSFQAAAEGHAMVISSFGLMQRDVAMLQAVDWAGVVLDEAQNIKNPESKQSKAARNIKAHYRIALTGTPVENHVGDLWSLMDFLNPGLLGTQAAFKQSFYRPIQVWQDAEAAQRLKGLTAPFILRRMKTDRSIISDLPNKIEQKTYCNLTREQASLYQAVVDEMQAKLEDSTGIERRGLVLATLSKLKQVCNHPVQFLGDGTAVAERSGKLARLQEILDEINELEEHTLIFTQFTIMGEMMQRHLQQHYGREVLFLHGGTSKKKRDEMVERFQQETDGPRIFILSLKAGGTGLTLTRANHVVHFDRWWNPAVENQATDRAFRIGQQRHVQVHKFIVTGTLEERIDDMIERKSGIAAQVVGSGEQWLTEMNNDELRQMIALGSDAVGE